ncbi:MAG: hypothetical protein Q8N56_01640 [bacterium]|nr:hypothetical protein [bacterium]
MKNQKKHILIIKLLVVLFFLIANLSSVFADDFSSENFKVRDPIINIFGGRSDSNNFQQLNAGGQTVIGESTSNNFILRSGFLYYPASAGEAGLVLTAPGSVGFASKTVSFSNQNSTGAINPVEVQAGSSGWSATLTSTNLTSLSSTVIVIGSNNNVSFSGTYDGTYGVLAPVGSYIVEITLGGGVGIAKFKWTDPLGNVTTNVATASSVALSKGVSVNFGVATYQVGEKWLATVDVLPYTGLTVTPSDITLISGSLTGVQKGALGALTGAGVTSNSKTMMLASLDYGIGIYQQTQSLELNIPANSVNGSFQGTITMTIL